MLSLTQSALCTGLLVKIQIINAIIHPCQQGHLDKLSQQEPELQELQDRVNDLLTEEACGKFESSVGELREQCETLDRQWEELREQLDRTLSQLETKVCFVNLMFKTIAERYRMYIIIVHCCIISAKRAFK